MLKQNTERGGEGSVFNKLQKAVFNIWELLQHSSPRQNGSLTKSLSIYHCLQASTNVVLNVCLRSTHYSSN